MLGGSKHRCRTKNSLASWHPILPPIHESSYAAHKPLCSMLVPSQSHATGNRPQLHLRRSISSRSWSSVHSSLRCSDQRQKNVAGHGSVLFSFPTLGRDIEVLAENLRTSSPTLIHAENIWFHSPPSSTSTDTTPKRVTSNLIVESFWILIFIQEKPLPNQLHSNGRYCGRSSFHHQGQFQLLAECAKILCICTYSSKVNSRAMTRSIHAQPVCCSPVYIISPNCCPYICRIYSEATQTLVNKDAPSLYCWTQPPPHKPENTIPPPERELSQSFPSVRKNVSRSKHRDYQEERKPRMFLASL